VTLFCCLGDIKIACQNLPKGDARPAAAVEARQLTLTKPPGSLGRLEELTVWLGRWQAHDIPRLNRVEVLVFAGNHGVVAQGVSPYPPEVTAQMVANFNRGGAAINQLAINGGASLQIIPFELDAPTCDITEFAALDELDFTTSVSTGFKIVKPGTDLLALGEMGIGNTTSAAALTAALFGGGGVRWAGRETGLDDAGLLRKQKVVNSALLRHGTALVHPLYAAMALGDRKLAAIFGAMLAARWQNVPVLLDGFVCTAAAAPLVRLEEGGLNHVRPAGVSAETGHRLLLESLELSPLLDFGMRLGEGSGATQTIPVLRAAVACHHGMSPFAQAGVQNRE
jgi:nicotinate-nucleotide--dimethylbenzimidazole phosphoribosyltransferase